MNNDRGKKFESQFKKDWLSTFSNFIIRLPDQQSGYYGASSNPCDFISYKYPNLFLLEIKSHQGNTFPFTAFRQYEKLSKMYNELSIKEKEGIKIAVILWFVDHDKVLYIPISTFDKLKQDNKKSFSINYIDDEKYQSIVLPSTKKITFLTTDYSVLLSEENKGRL